MQASSSRALAAAITAAQAHYSAMTDVQRQALAAAQGRATGNISPAVQYHAMLALLQQNRQLQVAVREGKKEVAAAKREAAGLRRKAQAASRAYAQLDRCFSRRARADVNAPAPPPAAAAAADPAPNTAAIHAAASDTTSATTTSSANPPAIATPMPIAAAPSRRPAHTTAIAPPAITPRIAVHRPYPATASSAPTSAGVAAPAVDDDSSPQQAPKRPRVEPLLPRYQAPAQHVGLPPAAMQGRAATSSVAAVHDSPPRPRQRAAGAGAVPPF